MKFILTTLQMCISTAALMTLLSFTSLTVVETVIYSFLLAGVATKMDLNRTHLENKIFELKEKLENK